LARQLRLKGNVPTQLAREKSLRLALAMGEVVQRAGGSFSLHFIEKKPSGSRWPWERWYSEPVRLFYAPPSPEQGFFPAISLFFRARCASLDRAAARLEKTFL
jgi:hypothetical protein